jgi:hypothetical protein
LGVIYIMKNFLTILLGIACITVLLMGNSYWNEKIEQASAKNTKLVKPDSKQTVNSKTAVESEDNDIAALANNWPAPAVERLNETISNEEVFKILFVGSPSIGSDSDGIYPIVKNKLIESYGDKNIEIGIKTFDTTSTQFIANNYHEEIAEEAADLVVLEPLTLNDNGNVSIEESINNLS